MTKSASLGFPRIGAFRELKKAVEGYWKGNLSKDELLQAGAQIRKNNWQLQKNAGITYVPSNDFSYYDHILDMIATVGAVPKRFNFDGGNIDIDLYFAMARGLQKDGTDVFAMEMTKWFDTNYHYIVPEFSKNQEFKLSSTKIIDQYEEAKALGIETRPVIIGPVSFLLLGKMVDNSQKWELIDSLLEVYSEIFAKLSEAGVKDIQIDEPYLVTNLQSEVQNLYKDVYKKIRSFAGNINIHLATYFDDLADNAQTAFDLDVDSVHIDLVRAPNQLENSLNLLKDSQSISLGLVDGRNIWINDIEQSSDIAKNVANKIGSDRVIIAPSCQLLHTPVDLDSEKDFDSDIKSWLSFATQKLAEINAISKIANSEQGDVLNLLNSNKEANASRKISNKIHNSDVKKRASLVDDSVLNRNSSYDVRKNIQKESVPLPHLPTTTIGSFPQTKEVRKHRADFKAGRITLEEYNSFIEEETARTIKFQEDIGLDVLVHGEFERNDMVEYFGEQLNGFTFTKFGWVQSYGSRCVKPPIIFGDVSRDNAMTVKWSSYAQSLTENIMKGMLTGPITILQWSFVRNDQPRKDTAMQIAFAIRDEVVDLEKAGIKVIQIDEAALREGLPIRKENWKEYLKWAVEAFRVSASGVDDKTQIHTHMCYSEFNDIIESIADMDADVISIETSRSNMELLDAFIDFKYPNDIGPGVYDIHSPRVPALGEMVNLLNKALNVLNPDQIWVNPDCGLKTRDWPETKAALELMVKAANEVRSSIADNQQRPAKA
ncbi:5-methyltetrahydropteroyltriglutamate--homocysteine S-methyltransferase [Rickettsiales bacterium]|nr:5-methyltetrahydropteroyltriglutamate--homocysteine S-methyltransferase [Rickettsiales bacterium]